MSVPATNPPNDRTTELQSKLYQAAKREPSRRFHALYDKLALPSVLQSAGEAVSRNRGAAGIDQQTLAQIEAVGVPAFLAEIAQSRRAKRYRPQPVRRVAIPKGDGGTRPLGIPTVRDRVVQAAAKLLLEPIFEADFAETSFGFRPEKGPLGALEAVYHHSRQGFRYVVDADIQQFFDTLDHGVSAGRGVSRHRPGEPPRGGALAALGQRLPARLRCGAAAAAVVHRALDARRGRLRDPVRHRP